MSISPMLVPLFMFAALFGIAYLYFTTRNRERLALIEKGVDAGIFKEERNPHGSLKNGMVLLGIAIGMVVGFFLDEYTRMEPPVAYFSMMFLFGGVALVVYYMLERQLNRR